MPAAMRSYGPSGLILNPFGVRGFAAGSATGFASLHPWLFIFNPFGVGYAGGGVVDSCLRRNDKGQIEQKKGRRYL